MHTACAATSMTLPMACLSRLRSWNSKLMESQDSQTAPRRPVARCKNGLNTPLAMLCELHQALRHCQGLQRVWHAVCSGACSWIQKVRMR